MEKSGYCETCAHRETCRKTVGIMFGFCNTDYEPEKEATE